MSIITNASVIVAANEFYEEIRYTVPSIIVFTDTPEGIETARATVVSAVKAVFEGRTVTVEFEFEK